jgi:hypothetical protein
MICLQGDDIYISSLAAFFYPLISVTLIHGWLNYEETRELFEGLNALELPQYEASFEAMEAFRPIKPGPFECPEVPFDALSLSFVRTVAAIAIQDGKGVLWGNDVLFPTDYAS